MYAVVNNAVEATIAVEVLSREFYGEITACTTGVPNHLVLHDSKLAGVMNKDNSTGRGVIQLLQSVVSVSLEEMLVLTIVVKTGDAECERTITFTPHINGGDADAITLVRLPEARHQDHIGLDTFPNPFLGGGVFMAARGGGVSVAAGGSGVGYDEDVGEVWGDLEPFFFDEAEAVVDHERRMRREQEAARRLQAAIARENANKAVLAKISDYDPKQDGEYYNRFHFADFSKFDLDEECNKSILYC
ncbi:unnamed protein product [Miscanthus lutarioriparius]|uniref:DUF6598 domain-containing protein n=1 Tax=Miscanthus lutarioriparius TaxID=422564 RepID=A0A811RJ55_9POAL|nr:unnamed protein product [Miscanthus lutarioriparius]